MSENEVLKTIRSLVKPARIYEILLVTLSDNEWAVSVALRDGPDRRFRFTRGRLWDEADIGDMRPA